MTILSKTLTFPGTGLFSAVLLLLGCETTTVRDAARTRDTGASAIDRRDYDAGEEPALEAGSELDAAPDAQETDAGAEPASTADAADALEPVDGSSELALSCAALAEASCARLAQCELHVLIVWYGDQAQCEELLAADCAEALARPGAAGSADVDTCTAKLPSLSCDQLYAARWGSASSSQALDYDMVFQICGIRGSLAEGEPCVTSAQCLAGHCTYRQGYGDTACGVCQAPGTQGTPCGEPGGAGRDCAQGYYCRRLGAVNELGQRRHECTRTAPVGGVCYPALMSNPSDTIGCSADGHCPWSGDGSPEFEARCIAKRSFGESCHLPTDEQQHYFCAGTLRCDPNTRTCREGEAELRAAWGGRILGGACDMSDSNPEFWQRCRYPALCIDGVCALAPLPACEP